jgi:fused signal recognition particle receptor
MFSRFVTACRNLFSVVTTPFRRLFGLDRVDEDALKTLTTLLIDADVGVAATHKIMDPIRRAAQQGAVSGTELKELLRKSLLMLLESSQREGKPLGRIVLLVGVNGTGKTTTAAKLAAQAQREGKRVLLVAADTFRAAAVEQLSSWAHRIGVTMISGSSQQDPASVVFTGCTEFRAGQYDLLIVDTAGRLQTKSHLMDELAKIRRVINKQLPQETVSTLLTIDSLLGQNSFHQAELFHQTTPLDGIILTKCDSTGRGGIIFPIVDQLHIPIRYITTGEGLDDIAPFQVAECVDALLS